MDITAIPVGWSAGGLLALVVLLVIRGDIIPRKWHEETRADRDQEREARHAQEVRLDKQGEALDALVEGQATILALIKALPRHDDDDEGGVT